MSDRVARYRRATDEIARATQTDDDLNRRMRHVVDALWTHLNPAGVSWVGFYVPAPATTGPSEELVLGPSRNKPACSPIGMHGVCGQAYLSRSPRIVRDVAELGTNYVACDPRDRSEIVVPLIRDGRSLAVLDLDSHEIGCFGAADLSGLREALAAAGLPTWDIAPH